MNFASFSYFHSVSTRTRSTSYFSVTRASHLDRRNSSSLRGRLVKQDNSPDVSILLPTYNRPEILPFTIQSILKQGFGNFELLIWDDSTNDATQSMVGQFPDNRIRYHRNSRNLGLGRNLQACFDNAVGKFIYLMADDDLLLPGALNRTIEAFRRGSQVGVVTRPYYMFWDNPSKPIRVVLPYDAKRDAEISILGSARESQALIRSIGQMSGIAMRREYFDCNFHNDIFPTHVYPFMSILKSHTAIYLKDFVVAIRTPLSMSTSRPQIYEDSPIASWVNMFNQVFEDEKYLRLRRHWIEFIVEDTFPGLLQIKTTASRALVTREIRLEIKYDRNSIKRVSFYVYVLLATTIPGEPLRKLTDWYKRNILSRQACRELRRLQLAVPAQL